MSRVMAGILPAVGRGFQLGRQNFMLNQADENFVSC
jgi:hypothetical protein